MVEAPGDGSSLPASVCRDQGRRILYETVLHAFLNESVFGSDRRRALKKNPESLICPVCGASGVDTDLGVKADIGNVVCRPQSALMGRGFEYADPSEGRVARGDERSVRIGSGYILAGPNVATLARINVKQRREADYPFTLQPDTTGMKKEVVEALITAKPPFVLHVCDRSAPDPIPVTEDENVRIGNGLPLRSTRIYALDREIVAEWKEVVADLSWTDVEALLDWRDGFRSSIDQATLDRIDAEPGRRSVIRRIVRNTPEQIVLKHLMTT